jgi:hypothetical protein
MALSKIDPELHAHKSWLGLVQPVGLVVSPPALSKAQVVLDRNAVPIQQALQAVVLRPASVFSDAEPVLLDFPRFACEVLGWSASDLAGAPDGPPLPDCLAVPLPGYDETLRPTYAVVDAMAGGKVLMLVQVVERGPLDKPRPELEGSRSGWPASPQARLERLLRGTGTATGLLLNGDELRLVYAPGGESSGHMGFPIAEMCTVSGRPLVAALHMLLCEHRVFSAPDKQRLLDLLEASRKHQSEVSNRLAEQVLGALWELLRGFQSADEAAHGRVLFDLPRSDPQHIYGGLLTVIMRLVFLLYAEDQGLLPDDPVYTRNYSIGGLFERLREDAGRYPDTMDQRFGAYAWLLSTFRMIFDGGSHGGLQLPTRHGQLFHPDEYPFLEGRPPGALRVLSDTFEAPRVPDGVIWRILSGLLLLDGERLSYRALDVEQVGSVYESMMGFDVRTLPGRALAVRPKSIVIDLDALLAVPANRRAAWLKEQAECDLSASYVQALKESKTVEDVVVALGRKVAPQTEHPLPPGALFLQPGEERRRSGSHYTPRDLTEPIVRRTLRPVLEALGPRPTPQQILEIKDDLRYTPSDCFETFPFPVGWEADARLEAVGKQYDDFRATLMQKRGEGLTDTYNRFHDPCVCDPDIETLRTLHAELDRAVLDAYGFADVATRYEFLLDYEEEESEEEASRRRKKPFRLRWPDAVRDDVLARLLDLNQQCYQEEVIAGLHGKVDAVVPAAAGKPKAPRKTTPPAKSKPEGTLTLFSSKKEDG